MIIARACRRQSHGSATASRHSGWISDVVAAGDASGSPALPARAAIADHAHRAIPFFCSLGCLGHCEWRGEMNGKPSRIWMPTPAPVTAAGSMAHSSDCDSAGRRPVPLPQLIARCGRASCCSQLTAAAPSERSLPAISSSWLHPFGLCPITALPHSIRPGCPRPPSIAVTSSACPLQPPSTDRHEPLFHPGQLSSPSHEAHRRRCS